MRREDEREGTLTETHAPRRWHLEKGSKSFLSFAKDRKRSCGKTPTKEAVWLFSKWDRWHINSCNVNIWFEQTERPRKRKKRLKIPPRGFAGLATQEPSEDNQFLRFPLCSPSYPASLSLFFLHSRLPAPPPPPTPSRSPWTGTQGGRSKASVPFLLSSTKPPQASAWSFPLFNEARTPPQQIHLDALPRWHFAPGLVRGWGGARGARGGGGRERSSRGKGRRRLA